jgi:hypothetical protein
VNAIISRAAEGAWQDKPATVADVMREYNTAASKQLRKLEGEFNRKLPSGTSPIVYLDYDIVATWFGMREGPATVEKAIGDYLTVKTDRSYDAPTLSRLARAMNSPGAEGIVVQKEGTASCLVVPVYPGISFDSFMPRVFGAGQPTSL